MLLKSSTEGKQKSKTTKHIAKQKAEAKKIEDLKAGMTTTASGLLYKITKINPER